MPFLETLFLGSSLQSWLIAIGVMSCIFITCRTILRFAVRHFSKRASLTGAIWDDIVLATLEQTKPILLLVASVCISLRFLALTLSQQSVIDVILLMVIIIQVGLWANGAFTFWLKQSIESRRKKDEASITTFSALGFFGKVILWSGVTLLVLDNMGIDITAFIAGLGIGGIALALATQKVLSDIFASLSIVFDKPFALGDFIVVQEQMGTVENIGLKTTRIRSLSGEQIVISNSDLLDSRIQNFKRMQERRVVFTIGVTYDATYDQLADLGTEIKNMITSQENVRFDRAHFKQFTYTSLEFEVVYFILSPDHNMYMDIQQKINLELYKRFEELGIRFAHAGATGNESPVKPSNFKRDARLSAVR